MLDNIINNSIGNMKLNQQHISISSQNIAKKDENGYTSKSIVQDLNNISEINRTVNSSIRKNKIYSNGNFAKLEYINKSMNRLETLIGSPDDPNVPLISEFITVKGSIYKIMNSKSYNESDINNLLNDYKDLINRIYSMKTEGINIIQSNREIINNDIQAANKIISSIHNLNSNLNCAHPSNRADIMDQQENELENLAKLIDIKYFRRDDDRLVILGPGWNTLLDISSSEDSIKNQLQYSAEKITLHGTDITNEIKNGKISGAIKNIHDINGKFMKNISEMEDYLLIDVNSIFENGNISNGVHKIEGANIISNKKIQAKGHLAFIFNNQSFNIDINGINDINGIIEAINNKIQSKGVIAKITSQGSISIESDNDELNKFIFHQEDARIQTNNHEESFNSFFGINRLFYKNDSKININNEYLNDFKKFHFSIDKSMKHDNKDIINKLYNSMESYKNEGISNIARKFITSIAIDSKNSKTDFDIAKGEMESWKIIDSNESGVDLAYEQKIIQDMDASMNASMNIIKVVSRLIDEVIRLSR